MVIVFFCQEYNERRDEYLLVASHALDSDTGLPVTVPPVSPQELGAHVDPSLGEYVIN